MSVDFTLYHNSQTSRANYGSYGLKWGCSYDSYFYYDTSSNVIVLWGDGNIEKFTKNVNGTYSPPTGLHDSLTASGQSCTLTTKSQITYVFGSGYRQLSSIRDENGDAITINHSSTMITTIVDPSGRTITLSHDGNSNLSDVKDPLGRHWTPSYTSYYDKGQQSTVYDLAQIIFPVINGASCTMQFTYDGGDNIRTLKDLRGNTSSCLYNADNSLASETDPAGNTTSFSYGSTSTTITDPNGHTTVHTYNNSGQLASVTDALNYIEYYSYDGANNVTQKQDRRGYYWGYSYDGMGNVLTSTPPGGSATTTTYNIRNKPLTVTQPLGRSVANTYDGSDNLTQVQQKDASGNVVATTKYTIGSYGLVSDKYDPNNHHTGYTYDANGYLNSTTTQLGHKTQWTYDALGFKTSRTDAMGRTTNYTPDAWERLVTATYPDNTTNTYGYDPNGNLTAFSNYVAPWTRTYDADNRMLGEYIGSTRLVSHAYDASGQKGLQSTTTDNDGRVISYAYSARNELASVNEASGTETYAYDADGNQSHRYLPNGLRTDQYYNADGTLDSYYDWNGGSTIYESFGYAYNADHQMTGYNEGNSNNVHATANPTSISYGYDTLGHLTSDTRSGSLPYSRTYAVDGAGNRQSMNENGAINTLVHDGDDALNSVSGTGAVGFTYNANGDQITSTINGQQTTYAYDFDDQLVSITKSGSTVSYVYDGLGRQVQRIVNGVLTGYYLDGNQMLEEKNASGTVQYTWGNGLVRRGSEYPMTDAQGTTKLETNSSQAITSTQETEAFGRSIGTSGSTGSPYGYHGRDGYRSDGDGPAGLEPYQKVGARYYDATYGRFLTRDTELSQSPYVYCNGDPVNCTDPTGHFTVLLLVIGLVVVIVAVGPWTAYKWYGAAHGSKTGYFERN